MHLYRLRIAATVLACAVLLAAPAHGRTASSGTVSEAELPAQARQTLELIRRNGPFPYDRDGVVFGNRERALPPQHRGYYHEFTVKTPGSRGRGARRIVCGEPVVTTRECYYTDDHYRTFRRIR